MTLSICTVTNASPERLEPWLRRARAVADEVVVTLDAAAAPATLALASTMADRVAVAELDGLPNPAYGWTAARATGDWVLMLDDDERLAPGFAARAQALMADRRYTHYHLGVRWVARDEYGEIGWLRQFPWWPNRATRMFRNVGRLAWHAAEAHSTWRVPGEGRALDDADTAIYHLDLLTPRASREAKASRYRAPGGGIPSCEEYYLYEDYNATLEWARLPAGVLDVDPSPVAAWGRRRRRSRATGSRVDRITLAELHRFIADGSSDPPIWSAEYMGHGTPTRLAANRGYVVPVTVRNTSSATWRSLGQVHGRVLLSYRWLTPDGAAVVPQGDISLLEHALAPGDSATIEAGLWTPEEPGTYRLEWDMLCERVAWFSNFGVPPLGVEAEVEDLGARPAAPHFPRQAQTGHPA